MSGMEIWSWGALFALGAFHGINPGMGWLFAVALGMQEQRRGAVWGALIPLGVGHALAVATALLVALAAKTVVPDSYVRWPVSLLLVALGISRLVRHRHPRWASMRVDMKRLTAWSFLMATAHGAGLMVLPIFLHMTATAQTAGKAAGHHAHAMTAAASGPFTGLIATLVHGAGYLSVTAFVAWIVYEKLGVGLLRRAWINIDLIWAGALIATGLLTVLM
jgi:hypothetical protein